ncbi:MAG: hypothetical protein ACK4R6_10265 [Spirosomataceae bacterium]
MKNNNFNSITFFYPSRKIGGAQMLFIRLALEISKYDNISVNIIDYRGGYLESQVKNIEKINVIPYIKGCTKIEHETILITPLSNLLDINKLFNDDIKEVKILLWSIHPENLKFVLQGNGRKWFANEMKAKKIIKEIALKGVLTYMDAANFQEVKKKLSIETQPEYLQIPIIIENEVQDIKIYSETVNIAWLGRLAQDKIYSILKIIDEISISEYKDKIVFHVIGGGVKESEIRKYLVRKKIKYVFTGVLEGRDLSRYMVEKIQIGVAMGTSCMEFATRRVPVFIVDYSASKFPLNVKYDWLYQTQDYTLGMDVQGAMERKHNFDEIINDYLNDKTLGDKCYNYVKDNHDIGTVVKKLLNKCEALKEVEFSIFRNLNDFLIPTPLAEVYILYSKIKKMLEKLIVIFN